MRWTIAVACSISSKSPSLPHSFSPSLPPSLVPTAKTKRRSYQGVPTSPTSSPQMVPTTQSLHRQSLPQFTSYENQGYESSGSFTASTKTLTGSVSPKGKHCFKPRSNSDATGVCPPYVDNSSDTKWIDLIHIQMQQSQSLVTDCRKFWPHQLRTKQFCMQLTKPYEAKMSCN